MGQALLMFAILAVIVVISWIPVGCLFGIFLYLGVDAMHGNEIWERINLMFMYAKKRPPIPVVAKTSSWRVVQYYTAIQFGLAIVTFGIAQFATWGKLDLPSVNQLILIQTSQSPIHLLKDMCSQH